MTNVIVQTSGGVYSEVRATNQHFAYNARTILMRVISKSLAAKQSVSEDVYVLSSLPMKGDKQLESEIVVTQF